MIKESNSVGFKKLPTSEKEALESPDTPEITIGTDSKRSISEKAYNKNISLMKNSWFILFLIICGIIISIWISTELYWLLFEYDIITGKSNLTIIINVVDKRHNLSHLFRTLIDQSFSSYEILITKNFQTNYSELPFLKFRKKNVKIKFMQYDITDSNLKMRLDSASVASGDYILFLDPDEYFPSDILNGCYNSAIKQKADITQFSYFHDKLPVKTLIHQPSLFDSMFFEKDIIDQKQYHITGKIIKKSVFIEAMKDIDNYYLEKNNILFEESMIVFKLFQKAKSFIKIRPKNIYFYCEKKNCPKYLYNNNNYSEEEIRDILIYLKFLFQYTNKKVYEKRMAAFLFIELLIKKYNGKQNYTKDLKKLLDEVIELYSNCDLINEFDIYLIKLYGNYVSELLGEEVKPLPTRTTFKDQKYIFEK